MELHGTGIENYALETLVEGGMVQMEFVAKALGLTAGDGYNVICPRQKCTSFFPTGTVTAVKLNFFKKHQSKAGLRNTALMMGKIWEQDDCNVMPSGNTKEKCPHLEGKAGETSTRKHL